MTSNDDRDEGGGGSVPSPRSVDVVAHLAEGLEDRNFYAKMPLFVDCNFKLENKTCQRN